MARTTIRTEDVTDSEVTTAKMAIDPTDASTLASGTVPTARLGSGTASSSTFLRGDQTYDVVDTSGIATNATAITANQDDIALLAFKVASNGSLAKYNLVDQAIDAFEDASGVDASASTNELRNDDNYYIGATGNEDITAFTASGTFTTDSETTSVEVLVVGGGGGGANTGGSGGGGAGGVVHHTAYVTTVSTAYAVTVGAGGGSQTSGSDSVFDTAGVGAGPITAVGGGWGGRGEAGGTSGGSGGGGGYPVAGGEGTQGDSGGGTGYGNDGGAGANSCYIGGGGGGADAVGGSSCATHTPARADGGAGKLFSSFVEYGTDSSNVASTGENGGYFGGGGGSGPHTSFTNDGGIGGVGGGGDGPRPASVAAGEAGMANTGGGAGGTGAASGTSGPSGATGGSGVVLVKNNLVAADLTLVSNSTTSEITDPDKGDMVMTYTNGAGTATINTDLKGWVSRDNGTTYTQGTLAAQGTSGGHSIVTFHDLDISGQPSGSTMRYKVTTHNQSAAKETRIQAVSLGWAA